MQENALMWFTFSRSTTESLQSAQLRFRGTGSMWRRNCFSLQMETVSVVPQFKKNSRHGSQESQLSSLSN